MSVNSPSTTAAATGELSCPAAQAAGEGFARRATWMALALLLLAAAATMVDAPASRWFAPRGEARNHPVFGRVAKVIDLCEAFGYGGTVLLVILLAGRLDPAGWRAIPRLAGGAFGGGLAADAVKMLVARMRPKAADLESGVLATFHGWLPILNETSRHHQFQSFPSAHTATAFGLATVLAWRYPRGAVMFFVLAAMAGIQRVQARDHFVSDVFVGAAIGILCGAACVAPRLFGGWFQRLERVAS